MVATKNLTYQHRKNEQIFSFPDIDLKQEESLLILGKSGIGKTTLLHLLAGLLPPKSGEISIDGVETKNLSARKLDQFRGQHIGLVFQKNHAVQSLTVLDNLKARLFFSKRKANQQAIDQLLLALDLTDVKHRKIQEISQGQLQRLGIAMAVVHNPKLILADEPTASLDDENCRIVIDLLKEQAKKHKANLIVITHDYRVQSAFTNSLSL